MLKRIVERIRKKHILYPMVYLCAVICVVLRYLPLYSDKEGVQMIPMGAALGTTIAVLFITVVWELRSRERKRELHPAVKALLRLAGIFGLSFYLVFILEFVNNSKFSQMEIKFYLLDMAGVLIIMFILFMILNSYKLTMIVMLVFYSLITMVFYAVNTMRGEPFQFIDIFSAGTAMEVAGQYKFVMTYQVVSVIVWSLCLILILLRIPDLKLMRSIPGKILIRFAAFPVIFGLSFLYLNYNWNGELGIVTDLFAPIKTYEECGVQVGFFCVAKYMRLTQPEDYSVEAAEKIAKDSLNEQTPNTVTDVEPVNIICVMNESLADYRKIGDLRTNIEVMPFYDSLTENTIKGSTLVCIKGGGTAKTEYEFLTGNSVKRFPAMVPYVSYFTHEQYSLVTTLEAQGYDSVVMHPYKKTNWNRPTAYRLLDFNEYISIDDFDENASKIRGLISDQANYEKIIERVNEKQNSNDKLFLFDITIQNHGGYNTNNYTGEIQVTDYNDPSVDRFLSLVHESDKALQYLISYFQNVEEPTLIVMFGDHYPALPDAFTEYLSGAPYDDLDIGQQQNYYATPFLIWANYDIPEQSGVTTSSNFLGTLMLEQTGLEMAPYNYYLKNMMTTMPALNHLGYMDAAGIYHSWSEGGEEALKKEQDYEYLQYNNLAENGDRLDWFFGMG